MFYSLLADSLTFFLVYSYLPTSHWQGFWGKLPGRSLTELTLGVVGCGNIGKAVLRRARAFGMTLLTTDPQSIAPDFLFENAVQLVSLGCSLCIF